MAGSVASRLGRFVERQWWRPRLTPWAAALLPLSWFVAAVAARRRASARRHRRPTPVPVIVVGNVVVGGAGKTPAVIALVEALQSWGRRPGIVSRGHGHAADGAGVLDRGTAGVDAAARFGDEPALMHRRTGVPVSVDVRRADALAALLRAHADIDVVVSDDGLQHHAMPRDIELVMFDERGAGNGQVMPAGPLRERLADVWPAGCIRHGAHACLDAGVLRIAVLNGAWPGPPAPAWPAAAPEPARAQRQLGGAVDLADGIAGRPGTPAGLQALRGRGVLALAAIGHPQRFFDMLAQAGIEARTLALPDHASFDVPPWPPDTREVIVTEKDAVKLAKAPPTDVAVRVVTLDFALPDDLLGTLRDALVRDGPPP